MREKFLFFLLIYGIMKDVRKCKEMHCKETDYSFKVTRHSRGDILHRHNLACPNHSNRTSKRDCKCVLSHQTIMSHESSDIGCFKPSDIGCNEKIAGSEQSFAVKKKRLMKNDVSVNLTPKMPGQNLKYDVLIWNMVSQTKNKGFWYNVSKIGKKVFSVTNNMLKVHRLTKNGRSSNEIWNQLAGQIFKIAFPDKGICMTVFFETKSRKYPFSLGR